ncbi:PepSY domain-containing protein [Caulobacter sp. DWR1-3-2b1]|uniref:PepSY domain-containing protein n=1 Tax=Caulobacter sp. DWR1-3-2b1 TaxID=2804670 RepID=UPI003CF49724
MLIDAETGVLTARPQSPWYITLLLVSQPLHFGDYGGLPLKILWAVLDLIAIAILVSGIVLWLRKSGDKGRLERLETAHAAVSLP